MNFKTLKGVQLKQDVALKVKSAEKLTKGEWFMVRFSSSDRQSRDRVRTSPNTGIEGFM